MSFDEETIILRWFTLKDANSSSIAALLSILDETERSRATRFRFERDRFAYVAAHALKRSLLAKHSSSAPQELRFTSGSHGKPELVAEQNDRGLRFSISHCAGMVAVAMLVGADIGIDVESSRREWSLDVAESFLSAEELAAMLELSDPARARALASTWTLKEAFVKAIGTGLSHPLDRLTMRPEPLSIGFAPLDAGEDRDWSFRHYQPDREHLIALAVRRPAAKVDANAISWQPDRFDVR